MPSRREPPSPTFFLDRSLGRHYVADAIRSKGFAVVLMAEVFDDDGQRVHDDEWIGRVSREGWIALTKDPAIIRAHTAALRSSTIRVFALPNARLQGPEMAERFVHHIHRIIQRARKPGPFVDIVHPDRIERRWPPL